MAKEKQVKTGMLSSRHWKAFLVIVAGLFTFGGPYLAYVFIHLFKASVAISIVSGLALFMVGLVLVWYLVKNKIIT
jgi:VIT1/CCC1 family predicted Fe2+/Mn2+ transporter